MFAGCVGFMILAIVSSGLTMFDSLSLDSGLLEAHQQVIL